MFVRSTSRLVIFTFVSLAVPAAHAAAPPGSGAAAEHSLPPIPPEVGALIGRAHEIENAGEPAEALPLFEEALALCHAEKRCAASVALATGGFLLRTKADPESAAKLLEAARQGFVAVGDRGGEAHALLQLALVATNHDDYRPAVELLERAIVAASDAADPMNAAAALMVLGNCRIALGETAAAAKSLEEALEVFRKVEGREARLGEVAALQACSHVYERLGLRRMAAQFLDRAATLSISIPSTTPGEARMQLQRSALFLEGAAMRASGYGEFDRALALALRALNAYNDIEELDGAARTLGTIAEISAEMEDWKQATWAATSRLEIALAAGDPELVLPAYESAADVLAGAGKWSEAAAVLEKLLAVRRERGERGLAAQALFSLAVARKGAGELAQSVEALGQVREMASATGKNLDWAALALLGEVKYQAGDRKQGLADLVQAAISSRRTGAPNEEFLALASAMRLLARDAPARAILFGKRAVQVCENMRVDAQGLEAPLRRGYSRSTSGVYRELAEILVSQQRLDEAQEVLLALKSEESARLANRTARAGARLGLRAEEAGAWTTIDRAMGAGTLQAETIESALASLASSRPAPQGEACIGPCPRNLAATDRRTAVVFTLSGRQRLTIILEAKTFRRSYQVAAGASELWTDVRALREAVKDARHDPRPEAQKLFRLLVAPMERDLQDAGIDTLVWSLDGPLRYLPLAILHDGRSWLVERYQSVLATPESLARLRAPVRHRWTILGLGVTEAHGDLAALPGVAAELAEVVRDPAHPSGAVPGRRLLDAAFTRTALMKALAAPPTVMHVSSHYVFAPIGPGGEDESYLLLGDGSPFLLRDWEALPAESLRGVDLLTLSACETALGRTRYRADALDGAEMDGLASVVLRKGVGSVLATLWPVSDASTPALLGEFYRRWQQRPRDGKAAALRAAQLSLIHGHRSTAEGSPDRGGVRVDGEDAPPSSGRWSHPYYWAGFILVGNLR